jgi:hypothetical protein
MTPSALYAAGGLLGVMVGAVGLVKAVREDRPDWVNLCFALIAFGAVGLIMAAVLAMGGAQ